MFCFVYLPFLVCAIKNTIRTSICFWFIAAILFTITKIIVHSFHWYFFSGSNAEKFITHNRIIQIIVFIPYPPVNYRKCIKYVLSEYNYNIVTNLITNRIIRFVSLCKFICTGTIYGLCSTSV